MISVQDACKTYLDGDNSVHALANCNLQIEQGQKIALLGKSGSGKTTLLNLLAGLDQPTSGSINVAGNQLDRLSAIELANYRRNTIGVVFQSFELIPQRSAIQNVELPLIFEGVSRTSRRQRAIELLKKVGLGHRLNHRPFQLSGGEKQRVAIARAMVGTPRVLLADEPTGNLDSNATETAMQTILSLVEENQATLLLITHDRQLADSFSDQTKVLQDGRIEEGGSQ